jgi:ASC-1-like (ASCH) protein
MEKHILKIREADKIFFDVIEDGRKTIETRAATPQYRKIERGDVLVFRCGEQTIEKKVKGVYLFENIDELLNRFDLDDVMPHISSRGEAKKAWMSFPGYQEKISKYGLIAWTLG